jgi:hypothetical protein
LGPMTFLVPRVPEIKPLETVQGLLGHPVYRSSIKGVCYHGRTRGYLWVGRLLHECIYNTKAIYTLYPANIWFHDIFEVLKNTAQI